MCTSLVAIPNPSRRYRYGIDQQYNFVPCNHCSSCIQLNQNDWYVRLYHEWKDCRSKGGIVLFPTLTYNPQHLPWYFDYSAYGLEQIKYASGNIQKRYLLNEYGSPRFMCPCFNLKHIQRTLTKLREYIKRDGDLRGLTFRYLVTSEFGEERSRPHYHALFFLDHVVRSKWFTVSKFTQLLKKAWSEFHKRVNRKGKVFFQSDSFGYVSYSHKYGPIVESINGLKYVSKYITKDFQYFNNTAFEFGSFKSISHYLENDNNKEYFRPYSPKHLQSINLGISGIANLFSNTSVDFDNLENNTVSFKKLQQYIYVPGDDYGYNIPRYYKRKLFKNVVLDQKFPILELKADGTYRNTHYMEVNTPVYRDYQVYKFSDSINRFADDYDKFFQYRYVKSIIGNADANKLIAKLHRLKGDNDYVDIALYEHLYKGLGEKDYFDIHYLSESEQRKFLRDTAEDFYFNKVYDDGELHSKPIKELEPDTFYHQTSLGFTCYSGLDELLGIIHDMQKKLTEYKTKAYFDKLGSKRKTKEYYNLYHYE